SSYLKYTQHTNLYTLSLHDALPISSSTWNQRESLGVHGNFVVPFGEVLQAFLNLFFGGTRSYSKECIREITAVVVQLRRVIISLDRKSTRLNSSHVKISYAVFCLKK